MTFCWYAIRLTEELQKGNSKWIAGAIFMMAPVVLYTALRLAHGLYVLASRGEKDELERKRNSIRYYGELASALALLGTIFTLANAYLALDDVDKQRQFNILLNSYRKLYPSLDRELCSATHKENTEKCEKFISSFNDLSKSLIDRSPNDQIANGLQAVRIDIFPLRFISPPDLRSKIDSFGEEIKVIEPGNELEKYARVIVVYSFVLLVASIAASCKFGVAIYDARRRVIFSEESKILTNKERANRTSSLPLQAISETTVAGS
jgi:hypothetical protein